MGDFYITDVLRSLASAVILLLNDIDPWEGYGSLGDSSLHSGGRLSFEYEGQRFPAVYGPFGTLIYPGIAIEGGDALEFKDDKFRMPIILSVTRDINDTLELDQMFLDKMTRKIDKWIRSENESPIYYFGQSEDHNGIVGTVSWYTNTMSTKGVSTRYVGLPRSGGWIRKEYSFDVFFTKVIPTE